MHDLYTVHDSDGYYACCRLCQFELGPAESGFGLQARFLTKFPECDAPQPLAEYPKYIESAGVWVNEIGEAL